jgi:hypothetical protein
MIHGAGSAPTKRPAIDRRLTGAAKVEILSLVQLSLSDSRSPADPAERA